MFDCATPCGKIGKRYLSVDRTSDDGGGAALHFGRHLQDHQHAQRCDGRGREERLYAELAPGPQGQRLYRDGSKLSQPLNSSVLAAADDEDEEDTIESIAALPAAARTEVIVEKIVERLPARTREDARSPQGLYPEGGRGRPQGLCPHRRYDDGRLGEIFIDMHKEGAAFRAMMNNFAIAISLGLQYGVPLDEYVEAFTFTRFEPAGMVMGNDRIKNATSILDYVFRELAVSYLDRNDSPREPGKPDLAQQGRGRGTGCPHRADPAPVPAGASSPAA